MPKPARHARVPQRIRVTGSRPFQRRPDVYQQVTEAAAGLVLGPALGAYRQLRDEPLIAVTEVQKRLFVNHTAEKRTTLGELARRHNYAEVEMALLIFGLALEAQNADGYLLLDEYGFPGARVCEKSLSPPVNRPVASLYITDKVFYTTNHQSETGGIACMKAT